jgi:hypothetical protein
MAAASEINVRFSAKFDGERGDAGFMAVMSGKLTGNPSRRIQEANPSPPPLCGGITWCYSIPKVGNVCSVWARIDITLHCNIRCTCQCRTMPLSPVVEA